MSLYIYTHTKTTGTQPRELGVRVMYSNEQYKWSQGVPGLAIQVVIARTVPKALQCMGSVDNNETQSAREA